VATGEDVGELLHVIARDHILTAVVLLAQAVDQLGTQNVDLAVQDAPAIGDVDLLLRELANQVFELYVRQRVSIERRSPLAD